MSAWLLEPVYWNWWLLGVVLMSIEAIVPYFFFLWMGVAALLVGLVLTVLPELTWPWQALLFAVLSFGSIVIWQWRLRRYPTQTADSLLNRRGHQYVGRVFTLDAPVMNGHGKIRVDDSTWKVLVDQDCPAGARLRIVGVDGVILKGEVEK
ncbi:MAG TPA: NfeD family protein [Candidatus Competibacteraceae bacterium]|nr:NfeD family protein [Candidatus Competibacteraceae bacterium]HRZ04989.1 NfeD family protein [Candidatus Competibacteraceae bacterium]HSA45252.1 NfeD family protein [Candidatus Competibacteraceae bacterium]